MEDTRGNRMKNEGGVVDNDRMPCVIAALITSNEIGFLGDQVNNLTFSLISPLAAEKNDEWHEDPPLISCKLECF
jgi:hypothetical protein